MKKFKFRYESILKMRTDLEDRIKNELASFIKEKQLVMDQLDLFVQKEKDYLEHIELTLKSGNAQKEMHSFSQGKHYYKRHKDALNRQIEKLDQQIEQKKEALIEAMKSKKIMEKLKEKAFHEFIEAINDADVKLIEEVVNYKNNRTNGE